MTNNIDLRTIPVSVPSICIPRVFSNIGEQRIRSIFTDLKMGEIDRIDVVPKQTEKGEKFNRVYVHFKRWNTDGDVGTARQRLLNGQDIKIVYDDPWFWKISAYRPPPSRTNVQERVYKSKAPRLEFDQEQDTRPRPVVDRRPGPVVDRRPGPAEKQKSEINKKFRTDNKSAGFNRRQQPPLPKAEPKVEEKEVIVKMEDAEESGV